MILSALFGDLPGNPGRQVRFLDSIPTLLSSASLKRPEMVVAAFSEPSHFEVERLRQVLPRGVIIAWGVDRSYTVRDCLDLFKTGVDEVITEQDVRAPDSLAKAIQEARVSAVVVRTMPLIGPVTPPALRFFLESLARRTRTPLSPTEAATAFHGSLSSLQRELTKVGFPSLGRLITWFRLFHAGWMLENPSRGVENVALSLGFPSRTALGNQTQRYTGLSPTELGSHGGLRLLLLEFVDRLLDRRWELYGADSPVKPTYESESVVG